MDWQRMRAFAIAFAAVLSGFPAFFVAQTGNLWLAGMVFLLPFGAFILEGLRRIPEEPPYKAVLTFFGRRLPVTISEGWCFLPFYPFVFGLVLVPMRNIPKKLPPLQVFTPDGIPFDLNGVGVLWGPNEFRLIELLNNGGLDGVWDILSDMISRRIREWFQSTREGPQTWIEARSISSEDAEEIRRSIKTDQIGAVIYQINIPAIPLQGETARAAQLLTKEQLERDAETVELDHVRKRIMELMEPSPKGPGFTAEQALEAIQVERGKVNQEDLRGEVQRLGLAPGYAQSPSPGIFKEARRVRASNSLCCLVQPREFFKNSNPRLAGV